MKVGGNQSSVVLGLMTGVRKLGVAPRSSGLFHYWMNKEGRSMGRRRSEFTINYGVIKD
ncbi:MAG: hypothetical protein WCS33_00095 [Candidatus Caldatribacteriota bacterium]